MNCAKNNELRNSQLDFLTNDFYKNIAYDLTHEERLYIKSILENKSCLSCNNASCRIPYYEKIGYDESNKPEGHSYIGWKNDKLVGKSIVLQLRDIRKM